MKDNKMNKINQNNIKYLGKERKQKELNTLFSDFLRVFGGGKEENKNKQNETI